MRSPLPAFVVIGLLLTAPTLTTAEIVNLLKNGGFDAGLPEPWSVYHTGEFRLVHDPAGAHDGPFYATFGWKQPPTQGYSGIKGSAGREGVDSVKHLRVYPGPTYHFRFWARGKGSLKLWVVRYTESGRFTGTDFGENPEVSDTKGTYRLTDEWQVVERTFVAPEGTYCVLPNIIADPGTVASLDSVEFGFERGSFTPPGEITVPVTPQVNAHDAEFELRLNGEPLTGPAEIVYGTYALSIKARATGPKPRLSGNVLIGEHPIELDARWRATATPDGNAWRGADFDDTEWLPVRSGDGIWIDGEGKNAAFRRVVLLYSSRVRPAQQHQWQAMHRDGLFTAPGAMESFVFIVRSPTSVPAEAMKLHLEAPAWLELLDKKEQGSDVYSNYHFSEIETESVTRDGIDYNRFILTYPVREPINAYIPWRGALYFKANDRIPPIPEGADPTFTVWREANGNITDVPEVLPITVTGPVNGRACKTFNLECNRPGITTSGGFSTYSIAERYAFADTMLRTGMNVAWVDELTEDRGAMDYWRYLKSKGVRFVWGFNYGMNWPQPKADSRWLRDQPELEGRLFEGDLALFAEHYGLHARLNPDRSLVCQELAAAGDPRFYDPLRPGIEEAIAELGKLEYVFWDWEYETLPWSCFCNRCKAAFGKYAGMEGAEDLSDEQILSDHAAEWEAFRFDQTARHTRSMIEFCHEYDTTLTVWHPGAAIDYNDIKLSPVKDIYRHHFIGAPGNDLPLNGYGRDGTGDWHYPGLKVTGQTIVDRFTGHVIDERMFKIWTINMALYTRGGGWVLWLDSTFPMTQTSGQSYFTGEATRLIHDHEPFWQGTHITDRFTTTGLEGAFSELRALQHPETDEALVLLFNQAEEPADVTVTAASPSPSWKTVQQWEGSAFTDPETVRLTVPPKDVVALRYGQ